MCTTCGCGHGLIQIGGKRLQHSRKPVGVIRYRMPTSMSRQTSLQPSAHYPVHKPDLIDFGSGSAEAHAPGMSQARMVTIERDILAKNNLYAEANRCYLTERGIFALNLVSSPGSGKTTLLVQTIAALREEQRMYVIEGDQQTENDAARIRACGVPALQINTGKGCHLDAYMVNQAMQQLAVREDSVLFIENVGNLVCPASFDLGEAHKVVILSVTEGEDKPLKYPDMFRAADLLLLNKCDLLPYLTFDTELAINYAHRINPSLRVIQLSALRGEGMSEWIDWINVGYHQVVASKKKIENSQHHVD
ncbi:hydrogenase nickel incorporation protein HypB [Nitrosomonas communis]|uniref:Hydrogenase maturation factor HypB n=1 Tax=Nitrosomonas communis TaxID=44574 RepID=A0A1I4K156_9PROT|nr:hydrogenase nickel incorporation protein HypB [Nitrosomonas communis]SFL72444.1 hydrogenase nickel incorporation protein HypB [Nitrosomonas communis]